MEIFNPSIFIIPLLTRKMSIVSEETDISCDFYRFIKAYVVVYTSCLHKLSKVTNINDLKYSSQHWNLMKQMSKKIDKLFTVQVGPY